MALLATLAGLSVVELAAAHLAVGHWHPWAAWVLTGLSAYSLLWLLAHGQAVRRRPVLLTADKLVVRVGLVWQVAIAREQVVRVEKLTGAPRPAPGLLNTARLLLTPPNLLLTLAAPQLVRGPYGLHRTVRRLAIYVDEPAALQTQLAAGPHLSGVFSFKNLALKHFILSSFQPILRNASQRNHRRRHQASHAGQR
ncbi:MAG: hypothetical protein WKG07_23690 [Hymenobacter sp.]